MGLLKMLFSPSDDDRAERIGNLSITEMEELVGQIEAERSGLGVRSQRQTLEELEARLTDLTDRMAAEVTKKVESDPWRGKGLEEQQAINEALTKELAEVRRCMALLERVRALRKQRGWTASYAEDRRAADAALSALTSVPVGTGKRGAGILTTLLSPSENGKTGASSFEHDEFDEEDLDPDGCWDDDDDLDDELDEFRYDR